MPKDEKEENGIVTLLSEADAKKYAGQYVCVVSFGSKEVIAFGSDPGIALYCASKSGHLNPVMFYVPRPGEVFIFKHGIEVHKL